MVTPIDSVKVNIYNEVKWIVAVCAMCGRWRDSCYEWITPPKVVDVLVEVGIIGISHTSCADCFRVQAQQQTDQRYCDLYNNNADRDDERAKERKGEDYQPGDIVHNLTLGILPSGKEFKQ